MAEGRRGQEVDEALEPRAQPHAVAEHVAGAGECVRDLEELLGGQHGANGRPADQEADVVQAAERRGLPLAQGVRHLGNQRQVGADFLRVGARLGPAGQLLPQRAGGVAGE